MQKVNKAIKYFQTKNVRDTNNLLKAVSTYVAEKLGVKTTRSDGRSKEPWWKRRIERDIKKLRRNIGVLEGKRKDELRPRERYSVLERKYRIKTKGFGIVIEVLKQRVLAKKHERFDDTKKELSSAAIINCSPWIRTRFIER